VLVAAAKAQVVALTEFCWRCIPLDDRSSHSDIVIRCGHVVRGLSLSTSPSHATKRITK
jgi:hypothetical protein